MSDFTCPHCRQPHHYLRDLLTCCPRELRALTTVLYDRTVTSAAYSYQDVLRGRPVPPRFRAVMDAARRNA